MRHVVSCRLLSREIHRCDWLTALQQGGGDSVVEWVGVAEYRCSHPKMN